MGLVTSNGWLTDLLGAGCGTCDQQWMAHRPLGLAVGLVTSNGWLTSLLGAFSNCSFGISAIIMFLYVMRSEVGCPVSQRPHQCWEIIHNSDLMLYYNRNWKSEATEYKGRQPNKMHVLGSFVGEAPPQLHLETRQIIHQFELYLVDSTQWCTGFVFNWQKHLKHITQSNVWLYCTILHSEQQSQR